MSSKKSVWSLKQVEELIQLYKKHECLWNMYNPHYKNKTKRSKAVDEICQHIEVTPLQFMKKIHNLRNQFNAEYKRHKQQLEDFAMLGDTRTVWKSKWSHYESLMFLKNVIVRRPTTPPAKKLYLELNNGEDEIADYDENNVGEVEVLDNDKLEEDFKDLTSTQEHSNNNASTTSPMQFKKLPTQEQIKRNQNSTATFIDFNATSAVQNSVVNIAPEKLAQATSIQLDPNQQDQWGAFGIFVANEMRNYNSDLSRRKLKRKIMQAMLEVAEEDELFA